MRAERVGLLGGTFDPPHAGHLAAARSCRDALALDRVLFVVANDPWQKSPHRPVTPAEDRYRMVEALVAAEHGLEASRLEIDRGGPSYTVDTVKELRARAVATGLPPPALYLIVGADLVPTLHTWERVGDLRQLVTLVVVSRPRSPTAAAPPGWQAEIVDGPRVDVSSSELRAMLAEGRDVSGLVPDAVVRCIRRRRLYAVAG